MQIRAIFALPSLVPPSLGALGSCPSRPPLDPPLAPKRDRTQAQAEMCGTAEVADAGGIGFGCKIMQGFLNVRERTRSRGHKIDFHSFANEHAK